MGKLQGEYIPTKEVAKIVREALNERWGRQNVSVRKGTGTATSWVEASVSIPMPKECGCEAHYPYCTICRDILNEANDEAQKRVYSAMEKAGAEFSTYYSDDGYNTERSCFLLSVRFSQTV